MAGVGLTASRVRPSGVPIGPFCEKTMIDDLEKVRNIGISAHIDSGKTTLTERVLYYTGRIHAIHEVRGKDEVGATMDSMELERERGITIASAATHCQWGDNHVNIIDTPGHVDFTIEVERALRVLDGAVLILCGVAGVQSQSMTVDRQMKRYRVPRIAFINKLDRSGADPVKVTAQLREKLGHNAILMQLPIGLEAEHEGVVDLVTMKSVRFDGDNGEDVVEGEIPADMVDAAAIAREEMLDAVSMFSDELMEAILEENVTEDMIHEAVRNGTLSMDLTPVFMGSAYKNKGVQLLLDAVSRYLPSPLDIQNMGVDLSDDEAEVELKSDPDLPMVALAFKLEDTRYGQLTYLRVYQGRIARGNQIFNSRTKKKVKVGRLIRMHSDDMEEIEESGAGDIVALFGIDCASGDTFTDGKIDVAMTSMHVPDPVISLSIKPKDQKASDNMGKALGRFVREDPTFRTEVDPESNETVISGMGELHLDILVDRMRREFSLDVNVSQPQVAYKETIRKTVEHEVKYAKQSGGRGQFGHVELKVEPREAGTGFEFINKIVGGAIPKEYIPAVEKGVKESMERGIMCGYNVVDIQVTLLDGSFHEVDSSEMAFKITGSMAFKEACAKADPVLLEPVMEVEVVTPDEFMGDVIGNLNSKRGKVKELSDRAGAKVIRAEVPLSGMFGYSTDLRSATQGRANFSMEFSKYEPVPSMIAEELVAKATGVKKIAVEI